MQNISLMTKQKQTTIQINQSLIQFGEKKLINKSDRLLFSCNCYLHILYSPSIKEEKTNNETLIVEDIFITPQVLRVWSFILFLIEYRKWSQHF